MNTNNVISAPVASDLSQGTLEHSVVKMTSTGIALCDSASVPVGTLLRANMAPALGQSAVGFACDVFVGSKYVHFAQLGATSAALASGAALYLDSANPGQLVPSGGTIVAYAWEAAPVTFQGAIIRVLFL